MKKNEQIEINNQVLNALKSFDSNMNVNETDCKIHGTNKERSHRTYVKAIKQNKLFNCNAYVLETADYIVLRSYSTVVAFIDKADNTLYDVLRYVYGFTSTSCKQISRFASLYNVNTKLTYKDV